MISILNLTGSNFPFVLGTNNVILPPGQTLFSGQITVAGVPVKSGQVVISPDGVSVEPGMNPSEVWAVGLGLGVTLMTVAFFLAMVRKITSNSPSFGD